MNKYNQILSQASQARINASGAKEDSPSHLGMKEGAQLIAKIEYQTELDDTLEDQELREKLAFNELKEDPGKNGRGYIIRRECFLHLKTIGDVARLDSDNVNPEAARIYAAIKTDVVKMPASSPDPGIH